MHVIKLLNTISRIVYKEMNTNFFLVKRLQGIDNIHVFYFKILQHNYIILFHV